MAKRKKSAFERLQNGHLNRPQRKALERRFRRNPNWKSCASRGRGIDIGKGVILYRDRRTGCRCRCVNLEVWTADLRSMAQWLKSCGGSKPWRCSPRACIGFAVYEVLEKEGLEVYLVNARGPRTCRGGTAMCKSVNG